MKMKNIAILLCNIPEGNYKVETEVGVVEVNSVWSNNRDFKIINILINGKVYDEITYSCFDYIKLYERIHFDNNGRPYKFKHDLLDFPWDEITYKNANGDEYEITSTRITNKSNHNITYNFKNGICISENKDIKFTKNLDTNEKLLYIKKFNCKKNNPTLENDFVCINGNHDYEDIIFHYNHIIESHLMEIKKYVSPIQELLSSIEIPTFDISNVRQLNNEIDEYVSIYKEFVPKLNEYHSKEMLKTLEEVALKLHNDYIKSKQEQPKKKSKKLFDISKFKN